MKPRFDRKAAAVVSDDAFTSTDGGRYVSIYKLDCYKRTRALALAIVVGVGGVAALTPAQAEARETRGGWDSRNDGGRSDNRRHDNGRYDRDRDHDRGWQRRHSRTHTPRTHYTPRYYRYTPPRPWTWCQTWPSYYNY